MDVTAQRSDVHFETATEEDDAAIRRLLRRTPMPGDVTIGYEREPTFFRSLAPMGEQTQVVVGRPAAAPERVVALGCRTLQRAFVDGEARRVEYLSQMRVDPDYRGRGLVEQGFRQIRAWHEEDPVPYSYATITDENPAARARLVDRPEGAIPLFRPLANMHTLALVLRRRRLYRPSTPAGISVDRDPSDLGAVAAFLREAGRNRPFFPMYRASDFGTDATLGFDPENLYVARQNGQVVGTLGLWDVSGHKQTVVRGYRGVLRWARPLLNVGLRLAGARPLPAPGEPLHSLYASMVCAAPGHAEAYAALLEAAYRRAAATEAAFLLVGGAAGDPLLDVARTYAHIPYRSALYTVHWSDVQRQPVLDGRPPAVEFATL